MRLDGDGGSWNHAATPQVPTADASPVAVPAVRRRRGWLPLAAVRPDYDLIPLNGRRLVTQGLNRNTPTGSICAVAYRAELRPSSREVVSHLFGRDSSVLSRTRITGGMPVDEYEASGEKVAAWSMDSAIAAAAAVLGRHVEESGRGAVVEAVREDTDAAARRRSDRRDRRAAHPGGHRRPSRVVRT